MKLKKLNGLYKYNNFPLKVLNFKRSKWLKLKKLNWKRRKKLYTYSKIAVSLSKFKVWNKYSKIYKNKLIIKRLFKYYLFNSKKNELHYKDHRKNVQIAKIFQYLFKISNVLRFSYQVHTIDQGKNLLFRKVILLNEKSLFNNSHVNLRKGDLVQITKCQFSIKNIITKYQKKKKLYPFFHFDAYTQNLIILKNASDLTNLDISLSISEYIDVEKLV